MDSIGFPRNFNGFPWNYVGFLANHAWSCMDFHVVWGISCCSCAGQGQAGVVGRNRKPKEPKKGEKSAPTCSKHAANMNKIDFK